MMKCDICGEEFKNLGAHKFAKHGITVSETLTIDVPTEKPLSELIDAMKTLLKPYQSKLTVSYEEEGGSIKSIEFTARIQVRR